MIIEAIWAVVLVGVPICAFTLAIVWWGLHHGHFTEVNDRKGLARELKKLGKKKVEPENANSQNNKPQNNKSQNSKPDLIQKNWAKFGGGFYGVVAFFTYLVVEIREVLDAIMNIGGLWEFIKHLDLGVFIKLFIAAIMNFVTAMVWPLYWIKRIDTNQVWMFFVAAYGGYALGLKLAQRLNQRRSDG